MTTVDFSTLLTSLPLFNSAALNKPSFRGSGVQTFQFESEVSGDNFTSNPIYANFKDKAELERLAKNNPIIMRLCKENGIPVNVNIDELSALRKGHLQNTRVLAAKMCSNLE